MENCLFCQILSGDLPVSLVYQDEDVSAFMDIQPINPGHLLVIPNEHAPYLKNLTPETGRRLFEVGQQLAAGIYASELRAEGINLFLADGEAAGQEVFHAHLHVIPRFEGDGFGFQFDPSYFELPERRMLDQAAEMIRRSMG